MLKISSVRASGFENAIIGMRHPLKSHDRMDSVTILGEMSDVERIVQLTTREMSEEDRELLIKWYGDNAILQKNRGIVEAFLFGSNDLDLAMRLIKAGSEHAKFMRQIAVSMNITAPLYWWKEMDQYRIGVTTNSESTMHRLAKTPITSNCFSFDNEIDEPDEWFGIRDNLIDDLERLRAYYVKTKDKAYWRALIQLLPSAWNQTRMWSGTYANLSNIVEQRGSHKLEEWNAFIEAVRQFPYANELIFKERKG